MRLLAIAIRSKSASKLTLVLVCAMHSGLVPVRLSMQVDKILFKLTI